MRKNKNLIEVLPWNAGVNPKISIRNKNYLLFDGHFVASLEYTEDI